MAQTAEVNGGRARLAGSKWCTLGRDVRSRQCTRWLSAVRSVLTMDSTRAKLDPRCCVARKCRGVGDLCNNLRLKMRRFVRIRASRWRQNQLLERVLNRFRSYNMFLHTYTRTKPVRPKTAVQDKSRKFMAEFHGASLPVERFLNTADRETIKIRALHRALPRKAPIYAR